MRQAGTTLAGTALAFSLCAAVADGSLAADFDGSKRLLCVPIEAMECGVGEICERSSAAALDIPQFVKVDFEQKTLSGMVGGGDKRTTAIQNVRKVEGRTILQGAENGRGWSLVIDQASGNMSASVAAVAPDGDRLGFVLFGACTPD